MIFGKEWLRDYPSTNGTRVLSTHAAIAVVFVLLAAILVGWAPVETQITVLKGIGLGLMMMMGLDVTQFGLKRFSDNERTAIKSAGKAAASPTVNVEGDASISATSERRVPAAVATTATLPRAGVKPTDPAIVSALEAAAIPRADDDEGIV